MKKIFTAFDLKLIALIFMIFDHLYSYLGDSLGWPTWIPLIGRFVAPLFVFFMIEGFMYTRNRANYFIRLFSAGILMHLLNMTYNLLTHAPIINPRTGHFDAFLLFAGHNIFMTLAFLFALIWVLDSLRAPSYSLKRKIGQACLLVPLFLGILISEGGPYEMVLALIFFYCWRKPRKIYLSVCLFCGFLFFHALYTYFTIPDGGTLYQTLLFDNEYMIITVLPFIACYNGKKGGHGKAWEQSLFYLAYPVHLLILASLRDLLLN